MPVNGKEYKLAIRIAGIVDKSYDVALVSANAGLKQFKAKVASIDGEFVKLDKGFNKIMLVGKTCFQAIATAAGVASVAIGAAGAASIKVGSEFEAEMSTVKSISGATADEMKELTEKAREVAQQTVFSATEVGSAMEYMGMAGWKAQDMISGIDGIISLAAASGEDLAMVSDIVTDSLTAMGKGADQAGHFADIMAQAAMNSNTNVELMGETFKYAAPVAGALGYEMEDLAIATGLMASSGIKGTLSGTALRNMLTRMAKPTKESQDAMDALGLSLENDEGRMYSLLEIMQVLRQNFAEGSDTAKMQEALKELAGLTDEQISEVKESLGDLTNAEEAFYAAELGGQRGMSGLLAIANSTDEEFLKLTEAIYNAEGAAELMASVRLDNLQGDVTILKDTVSDAGIELYYQFNDELRDIVQIVTEAVKKGKIKIPEMFRKVSAEFPTIKRKFTQYTQPVLDNFLKAGKWSIQNGDKIISILTGIGAALAAYKTASSISHLVTSLMSLGPAGWVILGVTAAIAGLTIAITDYKLKEKELVDNSLAEHFGTLSLSMEELRRAAEYLTNTESLERAKEAIAAFADLEQYEQAISDSVEQLNKYNWMVKIGMELEPEDQESYKSAIDSYVENAQEYALQARYAVSINLSTTFSDFADGADVVSKVDQFYSDQYDELTRLGTELNEAITDAFNDGLLDIKEVDAIARIQRDMAKVQESMAVGEFNAKLSLLDIKYGGGNLSSDSFMNLQEELAKQISDNQQTFEEAYVQNRASIEAAYEAGGYLTYDEYERAIGEAERDFRANLAEMQAKAVAFQLDTISSQYSDVYSQLEELAESSLDLYMNPENIDFYMQDNESRWYAIMDKFNEGLDGKLEYDIQAMSELYEYAASSYNQLEETAQMFIDAGEAVPDEVLDALDKFAELDRVIALGLNEEHGDHIDAVWSYIGEALDNGSYEEILEMEDKMGDTIGNHIPEAILTGITSSNEFATMARTARDRVQEALDESFSDPLEVSAKLNISPDVYMSTKGYWDTQIQSNVDHNAKGGFIQNKELSWLAEEGPEVVIPLNRTQRAISLWKETGDILGFNGDIIQNKELSWMTDHEANVSIPYDVDSRAASFLEKADQLLKMEELSNRYNLGDTSERDSVVIEYNPTLQFYGQAPSRQDLDDALRMSQDEFDKMMEHYLKSNGRVSFS